MINEGLGWLRVSSLRVQFCAKSSAAVGQTELQVGQRGFARRQGALSPSLSHSDHIRNTPHRAHPHPRKLLASLPVPRAADQALAAPGPTLCHTFAWLPPVLWSVF